MSERGGAVHVVTTRRRYKGRVYETHLLRRSYREDGRVKNETLGNLSHLPAPVVDLVRRALRGETLVPVAERLEVLGSRAHGHVQAVRRAMQRLGIESLISSRPSPERDRVCALIAARVLAPHTKLATTRWWHTSTLAEEFGVSAADADDLYAAMDWLLERQPVIERKLASRHLGEGSLALYDLSSSYFEGTHCPLGKIGYSRDGKKHKLQVNYGLMTTRQGCPISVSVYAGNTADTKTLMPQVAKLKESFGVERVVLVGDRGMISHKAIGELKDIDGMAWITALKSTQIRGLVEAGALQLGLFDERNLFEFSDPAYPGERLIACRNPELAKLRAHKRQALLAATTLELEQIRERVARGALQGAAAIGVKLGRVLDKYKVGKHFELIITDTAVNYQVLEPQVAAEAALDGIYVIRTGVPKKQMSAPEAVRSYKALAQVERAFRSLKTVDLKIRPIHHRLESRVRAHIFLCMLAYYVEWHLLEAWRTLLFADEDQAAKATRDPVAPAKRSAAALEKSHTHSTADGAPAHSLRTLIAELATLVRNTCRTPGALQHPATFELLTTPTALQSRAFQLLDQIAV
ncbi:MAG: IS1634 family transposase [Steroidobacteraceae bacterium]|nr:IS1634 family transposase [Pseudomonadota bacterium]HQW10308.1 IS1634 family transposase [Steroidobacteraceae bacterium]